MKFEKQKLYRNYTDKCKDLHLDGLRCFMLVKLIAIIGISNSLNMSNSISRFYSELTQYFHFAQSFNAFYAFVHFLL